MLLPGHRRRRHPPPEWPWQCPGCSRKYVHWHPNPGEPLVPTLVPMVDLYERSGRPKPIDRASFPGYVPTGQPAPTFEVERDGESE